MEELAKVLTMGFAIFLFVLAFLTAQEYVRKSETLLDRVNQIRNEQAVMRFEEEKPISGN